MATTLVASGTGVLLARWLGPAGRGSYAAATAYLGLAMIVFELGLVSAVVFFVSKHKSRADDYVRTSTGLFIPLSVVAAVVSIILALTVMNTADTRRTFLILPVCIVIAFLGGPTTFALQALDIHRWNFVRVAQPAVFLPLVVVAASVMVLDVPAVIALLAASLLVQSCIARLVYTNLRGGKGHFTRTTVAPMVRYGLLNMSSNEAPPRTVEFGG